MRSDEIKIRFHTLGCKLNFAETSTLARQFAEGGYVRVSRDDEADLFVVNTCSVTADADKKGRNLIRKLHRLRPGAPIVVTGCYAQLRPDEIAAIEGVSLVVGNSRKGDLFARTDALVKARHVKENQQVGTVEECIPTEVVSTEFLIKDGAHRAVCAGGQEIFAAYSSGDRTRAFLKVQDGCDYLCSYCTVPHARGASRNIPIANAVRAAREIAAAGQREIVLTGINTGDFGRTTGESFADLLRALDRVEGIARYRISSIEPNLLTDEMIALTASSAKFQPHFHIPLQNGSDAVLRRMGRRYTTQMFADRAAAVRRAIPDAFLGIDVIVGFPGETNSDFEATYAFLERLEPAYLHVFPYSVRPGTPASDMDGKVPPQTIAARAARLGELSGRLHRAFHERHVGQTAEVLFESTVRDGRMAGFTGNYLRVSAPHDRSQVNRLVRVSLDSLDKRGEIRGTILPDELF